MTTPYHCAEELLCQAFASLKTAEDCQRFFRDICTIKEVQAMAQRLNVAVELDAGKNYLEVQNATGASSATISRVSRCLNYGAGGYAAALAGLKEGGFLDERAEA